MINKKQAQQILVMRKSTKNLWSFMNFLSHDFWMTRKDELKPVADCITETYHNGGGNIAVSTPPRTAKSTLANYSIAWLLLQDKDNSIIRASYSQNLSTELNQGVREIIRSERYQMLLQFNKMEMKPVEDSKIKLRFEGRHRASLYASSVGGSTTGFGGNILIGDDLYKDHIEALSDTINNKTIDWFHSAFESRQDGINQMTLIIGTRWRTNELVDKLEKSNYFDHVFKIKALLDDNTSFNTNVISTEKLLQRKNIMHKSIFNSMYQQEPMEALEQLIGEHEIQYYKNKSDDFDFRLAVLDIADKGTDRTALAILDVIDGEVYLVDCISDNRDYDVTEDRIKLMLKTYQPTLFRAEDNNNTIAIRKLSQWAINSGISAEPFKTMSNKKTKILLNSGKIKTIKFPITNDKEVNGFIHNVTKYDTSQRDQHDDEIDVLAMACEDLIKAQKKYGYKLKWEE